MKSICIVIPYFGKLPKNIITYLISCKYNPKISWIIFTDDPIYKKLNNFCQNVKFIKCNLQWIKSRLIEVTGIKNIHLNDPYKLCDYKPLYGKIFSKYLCKYNYWGYSDLDIIYGNLWKYIKFGVIHNFDKIGKFGHFTLIRNKAQINNRYKLPIIRNGRKIYLFKDIISQNNENYAFDEFGGMNIIYNQHHFRTYNNKHLVNDIIFSNLDLNTLDKDKYKAKYSCYIWDNGLAKFFYSNHHKIKECDYGYFHFQKRHTFIHNLTDSNIKLFSITTYGYNKLSKLDKKSIIKCMKMNKSPFFKRLKYRCHIYFFTNQFATRMHIGKIRLPIKHLLKNLFIRKDFRMFKI